MKEQRLRLRRISKLLIVAWVLISIWGILNVYSTTYMKAITNALIPKSVITTILGFLFCFLLLGILRKKYKRVYRFIVNNYQKLYYFGIFALIFVYVFGAVRGGAKSVVHFIVDFQPLELVKITTILFMSIVFGQLSFKIGTFKLKNLTNKQDLIKFAIFMMIPVFLIFIEPDLGGAIIVFTLIYVMFILHGTYAMKIIKVSALLMIPMIIAIVIMGHTSSGANGNYQSDRIFSWLHPFEAIQGEGWDINNSLIGISNGNILGSGYLKGVQKTFINAASTDYIFVTICEEWGIFGALFTIGIILFIAYSCLQIGNNTKQRWEMLYCYGYAFLLIIQTVVNICGVTNVIPMTGVTLPFISNGLNSYLFMSIGLFICIVIARYNRAILKKEEEEWEL